MQIDLGKGYGEAWPGAGPWLSNASFTTGIGTTLLHFRVSRDGRVVGQQGPENHAQYFDGSRWMDLGLAPGVSVGAFHPTNGTVYVSGADAIRIYDRSGALIGSRPGYAGSQGIRWIDPDGTVHTGDQTYSGPPLWEWTAVGTLRIGQGGPNAADEGVRVVGPDGVLRALNRDVARFIRVNADGDQFAICYLRLTDGANVRLLCSRAELLAADPVSSTAPPPVVSPTPPENPPVSFPNHLDIVQRERAKFPQASLTEAQCFAVTNAVAADPAVKADGWGLTKAPAGGSGFVVNGQNYRLDKLCHPSGYINDILSDTPGAAGAQWGPNADPNGNAANWAPPVASVSEPPQPQPNPQPPSQPPAVDLAPVYQQIADLKAQVAAGLLRISALEDRPSGIPHGAPVTVKGHIAGLSMKTLGGYDVEWKGEVD